MIHAQMTKVVNLGGPALVNNGPLTTNEFDRVDWNYLTVVLSIGTTDAAVTAAKLTESDTSGSGHADIVGARLGIDDNIEANSSALPGAGDDDTVFRFDLDLRKRKRFIDATLSVGVGANGANVSLIGILSRGKEAPDTMAEMGVEQALRC